MTMKPYLSLVFFAALVFSYVQASAFPHSHTQEPQSNKFICVYEKHSKWYLEIDFASGIMYSYELYRDRQTLDYQTYSRLEDDHVYEFKSVDFSEKNREAYLAYFNPQKRIVTIIRVNTKPDEAIKSYQFLCSQDQRHLLLVD